MTEKEAADKLASELTKLVEERLKEFNISAAFLADLILPVDQQFLVLMWKYRYIKTKLLRMMANEGQTPARVRIPKVEVLQLAAGACVNGHDIPANVVHCPLCGNFRR
jgi:hypothetical protein